MNDQVKVLRIGIDCRLGGRRHAGIGRYIKELLAELLTLHSDNHIHWVLFVATQEQIDELRPASINSSESVTVEFVITSVSHYGWSEQLLLPWYFYKARLDLLHVPHFNVPLLYWGRVVLTIHDLLWHTHRGPSVTTLTPWQYRIKYGGYRLVVALNILRAKAIIVPSQTIANTIYTFFPKVKNKILVIYEGVNARFKPSTKVERERTTQLYVGSLYPHKNVALLLSTLQTLPDWELIVVTTRSVFLDELKEQIRTRGIEDQVTILTDISDESLVEQYQRATVLIQPSRSEGFGLTGIEALACGTPVIASDIPIFREIYQSAVLYINPDDPNTLRDQLLHLRSPQQTFDHEGVRTILSQYSWSTAARRTHELLLTAAKK